MKYYARHLATNQEDELVCTYFEIETKFGLEDLKNACRKEAQARDIEFYKMGMGSLTSYKVVQDETSLWVENSNADAVLQVVKDPKHFETVF